MCKDKNHEAAKLKIIILICSNLSMTKYKIWISPHNWNEYQKGNCLKTYPGVTALLQLLHSLQTVSLFHVYYVLAEISNQQMTCQVKCRHPYSSIFKCTLYFWPKQKFVGNKIEATLKYENSIEIQFYLHM